MACRSRELPVGLFIVGAAPGLKIFRTSAPPLLVDPGPILRVVDTRRQGFALDIIVQMRSVITFRLTDDFDRDRELQTWRVCAIKRAFCLYGAQRLVTATFVQRL